IESTPLLSNSFRASILSSLLNMVHIWEKDPFPHGDPRLPHHVYPPKRITPDELFKRTGANVWKVNISDPVSVSKRVTTLKLERGFGREDILIVDATNSTNFADRLDELYAVRSHKEEQAKMILEGEVYFDIEYGENWIRILCEAGDLLTIPENKMFRMATTPKNFIKMKRFFKGEE
ncbi:hypothetical protein PMAYCL1PPCAC_17976, partial [Pristionchus mayeri]